VLKTGHTIISAVGKKYRGAAASLIRGGASIVIHDPTELDKEMVAALKTAKKVIATRRANVANLQRVGVDPLFVPHPYITTYPDRMPSLWRAVAFSRIDFDKNMDIIIGANKKLKRKDKIDIWGAENRLYTYHKLDKLYPQWRKQYRGEFPKTKYAALNIARRAEIVVDMSTIKGDGGGTQYTFMEAWDAGAGLIINQGWVDGGAAEDDMKPGVNCLAVSNANELAECISDDGPWRKVVDAGRRVLESRSPEVMRPLLEQWVAE
jgi:hypothetical protein